MDWRGEIKENMNGFKGTILPGYKIKQLAKDPETQDKHVGRMTPGKLEKVMAHTK